jgi:hypothetical protein
VADRVNKKMDWESERGDNLGAALDNIRGMVKEGKLPDPEDEHHELVLVLREKKGKK